jgi:dedicator of cytokinesis protein 3
MWNISYRFCRGEPREVVQPAARPNSHLTRLVASYMEFKSPASQGAVERTHSAATIVAAVPVTFPESYPFSLIARSPTRSSQTRHSLDKDNDVFNPGLGEIAVVLLALVMASPKKHILDFLETNLEIEGRENFTFLVSQLFQMAISMLSNDAFPRSWLNVNVLTHTVLVKLMDPVAAILKTHFVPEQQLAEQFDASLWRGALLMLLSLLSSDQLVIEDLGPQVKQFDHLIFISSSRLTERENCVAPGR